MDDSKDNTPDLCSQAGGTWIDHSFFVQYNLPDWLSDQGFTSGANSDANNGLTLGILAPGQTWSQCMAANANTYSIGGSIELTGDVAFNKNTSISSNTFVGAVTGNSINTFFFGSGADTAAGMGANAPGLVSAAMGSATTFGRRTSIIMSLNLAGTPGGPAVALSQASGGVKAVLGQIGDALSLGMSFATRTAVDAGFTGAEALNCAIPR